jgi:3-oxoadipate enol-lactonase
MDTVTHHDRTTAYRLADRDGGPLPLYVHGSGATHRVWANQYGPDGPTDAAVAIDLSGHGASDDADVAPGDSALEAYTQDVVAVARETGADVLVGNSLGGAVVLWTLLERDLPVEGAVLAGSGAKLAVVESLRDALAEDFEAAIEMVHTDDWLFHDPDATIRDRSVETMHDVGRAVTERDFLTCHRFDVRDRLEEVEEPVLALVGDHDELTPPIYHEYLAEGLPHGHYHLLEGAAHLAMLEQPEAFNDAIADFLATVR